MVCAAPAGASAAAYAHTEATHAASAMRAASWSPMAGHPFPIRASVPRHPVRAWRARTRTGLLNDARAK